MVSNNVRVQYYDTYHLTKIGYDTNQQKIISAEDKMRLREFFYFVKPLTYNRKIIEM